MDVFVNREMIFLFSEAQISTSVQDRMILEQSKEIKQNWEVPGNFDVYF